MNNANSVITLLHDNFSLAKRFGDDAIAAFAGDHERYGGWVDEIRQYLTRAEHSLGAATHQYNSMPAAGDVPRPNAEQLLQLLREQAQRLPEHIRARVQRSRLENERQQQAMRIIDSAQSIHHALLTTVEIIRRGRANSRHATQSGDLAKGMPHKRLNVLSLLVPASRAPARMVSRTIETQPTRDSDVFICHASEDKDHIVRELAESLRKRNLSVWYDEWSMRLGDSLSEKISEGLARCRFGVVVISQHFQNKFWQQREVFALLSLHTREKAKILPVWHGVTVEEISEISPLLADLLAADTSKQSLDNIVEMILEAISPESHEQPRNGIGIGKSFEQEEALQSDARNLLEHAVSNDSDRIEKFQSGTIRYVLAGPTPFGAGGDNRGFSRWDDALQWLWDNQFVNCVRADHTGSHFLVTEAGHEFLSNE